MKAKKGIETLKENRGTNDAMHADPNHAGRTRSGLSARSLTAWFRPVMARVLGDCVAESVLRCLPGVPGMFLPDFHEKIVCPPLCAASWQTL